MLFHAGILGHAFVSYFFIRLKTLNILLIQALLARKIGRLLPGMGLLTKIRDIKNGLDTQNLITETFQVQRRDWIKTTNTSSSRNIISLFPWLCTVCSSVLQLPANYLKKNFASTNFCLHVSWTPLWKHLLWLIVWCSIFYKSKDKLIQRILDSIFQASEDFN